MNTFRVVLAQINTTVGDLRGNGDKVVEYIKKGERLSAGLILFPELAITGYPPEDLLLNKSFIKDNLTELKRVASFVKKTTAIVGFADKKGGDGFNAAAILHKGKIRGVYHKILLPNYGVFDEKRYFTPGDAPPIFLINGVKVAVNICEDIWHEAGPVTIQAADRGVRIMANLSSSPYHSGKFAQKKRMLAKRAKDNNLFLLYNNLVGGQDELVFDGGSMIFSPDGKVIDMGKRFEEDLIISDLPLNLLDKRRGRKSGSKAIAPITVKISDTPLPPPEQGIKKNTPQKIGREEEIYSALVLGLRDYIRKNGFSEAVLGLSGGIDSALTATLAVDAIGPENVIGVTMPSPISSKGSVTDSARLAKNLGMRIEEVDIGGMIESYHSSLSSLFEGREPDVAEENIQSRIRGTIIMALSNKFGWLPVATGNKSEFSTGYCTMYGDMAGGFAVLKDVPKIMVYQLAAYRNAKAGFDLIPQAIIEKEPSAELRPDQRDTDSLPPYDILDPIIGEYIENDGNISEKIKKGCNMETVSKIIGMLNSSEYKRRQSPP
ncbi:MAG: NAD+ synthase, partial [Nitrospinota bacterium]